VSLWANPISNYNWSKNLQKSRRNFGGLAERLYPRRELSLTSMTKPTSDELLNQFKNQAAEHARQFDLEKVLPRYEAFYERVMQLQGA